MARAMGSATTEETETKADGTKVIARNPALKPAIGPHRRRGPFHRRRRQGPDLRASLDHPRRPPLRRDRLGDAHGGDQERVGRDGLRADGHRGPQLLEPAGHQRRRQQVLPRSYRDAGRETSVKQLIDRVVNSIAGWAETQHYFATDEDLQTFKAELTHLLVHQKMSFNSPVWFNVGVEEKPQC